MVYLEVDVEVGDNLIVRAEVTIQTKTLLIGNAHERGLNKGYCKVRADKGE